MTGLDKFKNKSILLIAGGPTTNKINWDKINTDFIWSCNHFFLNPKCAKKNIDLFVLCDEVDLSLRNKVLHNYIRTHNSFVVFEQIGESGGFPKYYPNQYMWMLSKYRSKIGTAPRMMMLAIALGVKEIYFVGMDGLKKDGTAQHSFELNKAPRGTRGYGLFRRQYVEFWDYVLNYVRPNVKFHNLGEGHIENMTTDISQQCFQLSKTIRTLIQ